MGCNISCKRISISSLKSPSQKNKNIRTIVHLNGYVTRLDYPVTVAEVTGNNSSNKHFLFTHAQMLSNVSKPLSPETVLEAGKIYFLLPYSLFDTGVSPVDFAAMAKKLSSKARNDHKSKRKYKTGSDSTIWSSQGIISPSRIFSPSRLSSSDSETEDDHLGVQRYSTKSKLWKPELDTIREKSFDRRSDQLEILHENAKVNDK
ncbi:hypothetical protein CASFOL_013635 [Castilleja foliolosa]|uniref:Uncharacterized protein n=1 Tax=Castilleja foliolosa TaxID=1961234 RepID=A0ABD3DPL3_9LAMI